MIRAAVAAASVALLVPVAGCGGGAPLMHPARTLPSGDVRTTSGRCGQVTWPVSVQIVWTGVPSTATVITARRTELPFSSSTRPATGRT